MVQRWKLTYPAEAGPEERTAYLYLPPSCDGDPKKRYPVLYMFDGHNVFFDSDATYGKSWGMADYLDRTGTQLMVAAVECNHSPDHGRLKEYSPYPFTWNGKKLPGLGRQTMEWYVNVFKADIDSRFPTLPDRDHTFIAGSSMGGLMSLYTLMKFNKVFSRAAALSPSLWANNERLERLVQTSRLNPNTVLYMDYGSREFGNDPDDRQQFIRMNTLLLERNVHLTSRIVPGGTHCEASWEKQLPFAIGALTCDF